MHAASQPSWVLAWVLLVLLRLLLLLGLLRLVLLLASNQLHGSSMLCVLKSRPEPEERCSKNLPVFAPWHHP